MTNKHNNPYQASLRLFGSYLQSKGWVYLLLAAGLCLLYRLLFTAGIPAMMLVALFPLALFGFILFLTHPKQSFFVLFALQFLLLIISSLTDFKLGVATLLLSLVVILFQLIHTLHRRSDATGSRNGMLYLFLCWGLFCVVQLANPNNVQEAWNIAITHYLVYPVVCAILVPIAIRRTQDLEWLLILWSLFILYAAAKGYWQKSHGFNSRELHFLYVLGGAKTHLIWSGIRYFSCFSDAATYGVHMAMAATTFGISVFYVRSFRLKIYFTLILLAALYAMGISGTRAAIAVPFAGLALFILLSRNFKATFIGIVALLALFAFFRFTTIGQGNEYVRKMRTAFTPTQDASYQVRVNNRKQMAELMKHKPIGYGMGLSKGERFGPKERMPFPPDSWLVSVWVENGIIGLTLYLLIHAALFAWCSWILMFKIMNGRLRGLLAAWLCMAAGFFVAAYVNDVMQYPSPILVFTAFALCFAGPAIDRNLPAPEEKPEIT